MNKEGWQERFIFLIKESRRGRKAKHSVYWEWFELNNSLKAAFLDSIFNNFLR
jgi:hypothetical protein